MYENWLIIGLSGVTCSGKTTTANKLMEAFTCRTIVVSQDNYFKEINNPDLMYLSDLDAYNWDCLSSLNMNKMLQDITRVLNSETKRKSILIIEGFSILNFEPIKKLCRLQIYLLLDYEQVYNRRQLRTYVPPDKPQYFEKCVWPQHLKHFHDLKQCPENNILFIDVTNKDTFLEVFKFIKRLTK